jgi:hypothetical protein
LTGRKVTIRVEERDHYQMDGDTVGECSAMTAEVRPGALTLRVPRATRRPMLAATTDSEDTREVPPRHLSEEARSRSFSATTSA